MQGDCFFEEGRVLVFCETLASENSLPAREFVWVGAVAPAAREAASRTLRVTVSAAASPCMSMANVGID